MVEGRGSLRVAWLFWCYSTNGSGYHEIGTGIHRSGALVHTGTSAEQQWDHFMGYDIIGYDITG